MIDIPKMIEALEEFGADSVEYNVKYGKNGILYEVKLSIEAVGDVEDE